MFRIFLQILNFFIFFIFPLYKGIQVCYYLVVNNNYY